MRLSVFPFAAVGLVATILFGCSSPSAGNRISGSGATGAGGSSGVGGFAGGLGVGGSVIPLPTDTPPEALLPARIRRLTTAEYDASLRSLVNVSLEPGRDFAPDARQDGYTVNDAQRVDPILAKQLFAAAENVAEELRPQLGELAPCDTPTTPEPCADSFIRDFGARVYRRPLNSAEVEGLLAVYATGAEGASFEDGVVLVVRALLQSAGFLYLTELGPGGTPPGTAFTLTPYEMASALSYLITSAPPDQALMDAALAGKLTTPEGRNDEAWRLLQTGGVARDRFVRVVREWLGTDRIEQTAKDENVYPAFVDLKAAMASESENFIASVIANSSGTVAELLSADWTTAEPALSEFYGGTTGPDGMTMLPTRRGVLGQAAFLSVYAHAHESAPVLRGVAIARRIACIDIPSPTTLNIDTTPPLPDPTQTTRERFAVHTQDPGCSQCHNIIDPFGYALEEFDGMGRQRTMDNGKPVDSSVTVATGFDFDGSYANGSELATALAESESVVACFARHMFRASAGRSDNSSKASETEFLRIWGELSPELRGNIIETLITFVESPLFTHRRQP